MNCGLEEYADVADRQAFEQPVEGVVALAGALHVAENGDVDRVAMIVRLATCSEFKDDAAAERTKAEVECPMLDAIEEQQFLCRTRSLARMRQLR